VRYHRGMAGSASTKEYGAGPSAGGKASLDQPLPGPHDARCRLRPHEVAHPSLAADTDPKAERVQLAIYRAMSPARKLQLVLDSIQASRDLALAGLRARHPSAGPEELRRLLFVQELGEKLARKVYRPLTPDGAEP
jgi:hypothetical protein